ncbi:MAG: AmmeMemoRadiSam system protein A [Halieaceae bacterium]|jgi:uncharacterized protein|nr:AmmeMemoRadiSam system protein A [Halieaceae bacterium]
MSQFSLNNAQGQLLLRVAGEAIDARLQGGKLELNKDDYPPQLWTKGASFVTLHLDGRLKGCRGSIYPQRALVCDVAENATASAFNDQRFTPVGAQDRENLKLHVSVLNPMEAVAADSRQVLLRRLRPGLDGLLLRCDQRSAVFLPSVWDTLPEAEDFISQLQLKAGIDPESWSAQTCAWCYTVTEFE